MDQIVVDPVLLGALAMLAVLVAAAIGFVLGQRRPRAEDLARIAELETELVTQQSNAESTRGGIDDHFEASAALFGKLAQDYRALFEHWADSATKLGVSETRANAIIDQARSRLLENERSIEPEAPAPAPADEADRPEPDSAPAPVDAGTGETGDDDDAARADGADNARADSDAERNTAP